MTREKFVARLLDADGALLAWTTVWAEARPVGRGRSCPFFAVEPTKFPVSAKGTVTKLSIHWCDLDIARVTAIGSVDVEPGQLFAFAWIEPVWLVPGMQDVPLPAVTVGEPVSVLVPAGGLGVRAT